MIRARCRGGGRGIAGRAAQRGDTARGSDSNARRRCGGQQLVVTFVKRPIDPYRNWPPRPARSGLPRGGLFKLHYAQRRRGRRRRVNVVAGGPGSVPHKVAESTIGPIRPAFPRGRHTPGPGSAPPRPGVGDTTRTHVARAPRGGRCLQSDELRDRSKHFSPSRRDREIEAGTARGGAGRTGNTGRQRTARAPRGREADQDGRR